MTPSWTGSWDRVAFLGALERYRAELEAALLAATGRDATKTCLDDLDVFDAFVAKLEAIRGPSPHLRPLRDQRGVVGDVQVVRHGSWRAYYVLEPAQRAFFGAMVARDGEAIEGRLNELIRSRGR